MMSKYSRYLGKMTLKMKTPSILMTTPSILHEKLNISSSEQPSVWLNSSTLPPVKSSNLWMSCFTMILGTVSNLTALGILAKSRFRFRRQSKAPFLLLTVALLLADLAGHVIPGTFAMYLHIKQSYIIETGKPNMIFCDIFGASMVFFGLCPLLLGCAMAVERCVAITHPFFHVSMVTMSHVRGAVLLLCSLALILAVLPLCAIGTYTTQSPGTWCFLPVHGPQLTTDRNLALAFSCLGLAALTVSLLCNILSGLALLRARKKTQNVNTKSAAHCIRRTSSASSSSLFCSLDIEMMVQLAVITVVSCVCWSPFLIHIAVLQFDPSPALPDRFILLGLRMASWNQILDPWVYILLRRVVLLRLCCAFNTKRPTYSSTANREVLSLQ